MNADTSTFESQFDERNFWSRYCHVSLHQDPNADIRDSETSTKSFAGSNLPMLSIPSGEIVRQYLRKHEFRKLLFLFMDGFLSIGRKHQTSSRFWSEYLKTSAHYSILALIANIVALSGAYILLMSLARASKISSTGENGKPCEETYPYVSYRRLCVHLGHWIIINVTILVSVLTIRYFPMLIPDASPTGLAAFWETLGHGVLLERFLSMGMNIKAIILMSDTSEFASTATSVASGSAIIHGCSNAAVDSSQPLIYFIMVVCLNTFQVAILSTQPFPWPWALLLCGVQACEQCLTFTLLRNDLKAWQTSFVQISGFLVSSFLGSVFSAGSK